MSFSTGFTLQLRHSAAHKASPWFALQSGSHGAVVFLSVFLLAPWHDRFYAAFNLFH
jgi:hypothetical protein